MTTKVVGVMLTSTVLAGLLGVPAASATNPLTVQTDAAWTEERHPPPRPAAWQQAPAYQPTRRSGTSASECIAQRLDEWLRIRCATFKTSAITQLGGLTSGVSTWIAPAGNDRLPGEGQLYFPARKGDARVFLFWTLGPGYDGPLTVIPAVVVQQYWLEDEDAPVLLISDAFHEPVSTKSNPR